MIKIIQSILKLISNPVTQQKAKSVGHTFRKFPAKHANKAVRCKK
jgi:hypothetical protein